MKVTGDFTVTPPAFGSATVQDLYMDSPVPSTFTVISPVHDDIQSSTLKGA